MSEIATNAVDQPTDPSDRSVRRGRHFERAFDRPTSATPSFDRMPAGGWEIRRSSDVVSSDGYLLGLVEGFLVDPAEGITHVVLQPGHFWGRGDVAIPIFKVCAIASDRVQLRATREQIGRWPTVAIDRLGNARRISDAA